MTESTKGKNSLRLQIALILAVIAGLAVALYLPNLLQNEPLQAHVLQTAPGCDLRVNSCIARTDQQAISLSIPTDTIHSAKPLPFVVTLSNIDADQVMIDLQGKEMFMGLNQTMMERVPGTQNQWQANVTLAVCTTGMMTWIAQITTAAGDVMTSAAFEFEAR
ncbi:MAG: hypothetical protein CSA60_00065 [Neptuniibacter caesariensis]|uniref:YtkA-like domain-containing protein n=1 Tax=Neptuniibacter caesariensis TaxID=207954 RepID=A0A2G6JSM5_NEPCE|nr:MAG: hypothetical protein CSA60_00065 [Neptuniibacter caesariensis]